MNRNFNLLIIDDELGMPIYKYPFGFKILLISAITGRGLKFKCSNTSQAITKSWDASSNGNLYSLKLKL